MNAATVDYSTHDPLHGVDLGPCADPAPDTLGDDPTVCTTCFYSLVDHRDRWGRSITAMLAELDAAHAALDAAADKTRAADAAIWAARTDRQEDKAQAAWNKAHDSQNAAARRLHAANQALGRPARDDRR